MHILSTAKQTLLSDFVDLETISTYAHANGECTDFQFCAYKRIFIEVNRKTGLEVLRVKDTEQKFEIQRLRKLSIDNAYCIACAKSNVEEIAVGMSSGHVKVYNYKSAQLRHRFPAEVPRKSVLSLDFNSTDEYLASVLECGDVNIFGIKTCNKIETLQFDGNSTSARFHPAKRFQLAIASYKGAVHLYDMHSKRNLYTATDAHRAPCRDLCMCTANPTTLISVGYDCVINIFDIRRKSHPANGIITYTHPLSTVALSNCGTYFCVGNLKGELITYDMRNTRSCLASRRMHEAPVMRIAFVPTPENQSSGGSSFTSTDNATGIDTTPAPTKSNDPLSGGDNMRKTITMNLGGSADAVLGIATPAATRGTRDSFCDFLDSQSTKARDRMSTRSTMRRDSFDWEALTRKTNNDDARHSIYQPAAGLSWIESVSSDTELNDSKSSNLTLSLMQRRLNETPNGGGPLRERNSNSNISHQLNASGRLVKISEEQLITDSNRSEITSLPSDKENPPPIEAHESARIELPLPSCLRKLPANRNSTPHVVRKSLESFVPTVAPPPPPPTASMDLPKSASTLSSISSSSQSIDLHKEFAELRQYFDARMDDLEFEFKLLVEKNKWEQFTQISNFWTAQKHQTDEVHDSVVMLLERDTCINELKRLQYENTMLKEQVNTLQQQVQKKKNAE